MFTNIKEFIIFCFIFCIILFLYLHIQFHLKTHDDLEIYEIDQASKDKIEEICDLRQPVLFDCDEDINKIIQTTSTYYVPDTSKWSVTYLPSHHCKGGPNTDLKMNSKEKNEQIDSSENSEDDDATDDEETADQPKDKLAAGVCLLKFKK
jgi:hypothetical protein